jgi:hypothetical protein
MTESCNTFWASHGCDLPEGHDSDEAHPIHECVGCTQMQVLDEGGYRIRSFDEDDEGNVNWNEEDWYDFRNGHAFRPDTKPVR